MLDCFPGSRKEQHRQDEDARKVTIKNIYPSPKVVCLAKILEVLLKNEEFESLSSIYLPQFLILLMKIKQSGLNSTSGIISDDQMLSIVKLISTNEAVYNENLEFLQKYKDINTTSDNDYTLPDKKTVIDLIRQGIFSCKLILQSIKHKKALN